MNRLAEIANLDVAKTAEEQDGVGQCSNNHAVAKESGGKSGEKASQN